VAIGERIVVEGAVGHAVVTPEVIPSGPDTLYDLASLTKPLVTALLALLLRREGRLRLDDRLSRHLPGWRSSDARAGITLLDLLVHRSGLPAWRPLYLHASDRQGRIAWLDRVPLDRRPGDEVAYSCPGYILLGMALEEAGGAPLDRMFRERVATPLGLSGAMYTPPPALKRRTAATETGNLRERSLAGAAGAGYNEWRTDLIWGEVHDTNARTLGGVAGNAGLFGTARDVHRLVGECLGTGNGLLDDVDLALFRRSETAGLAEERSIGFQIAVTAGASAGEALASDSFGHTGYTGTSVWVDPGPGRIYVLLTNRLHPRYRAVDMNAIRRRFHAIAAGI
jgi:CubicO group peptidase (beta-lactamase class C family)